MQTVKRFGFKKVIGILSLGSVSALLLSPINAAYGGGGDSYTECLLSARPYIQALKHSQNSAIRIRAATELEKIPRYSCSDRPSVAQEAHQVFIKVLKTDPDPAVRAKAALAFRSESYHAKGEALQKPISLLLDVLKNDQHPEVRYSAAVALWDITGDSDVGVL